MSGERAEPLLLEESNPILGNADGGSDTAEREYAGVVKPSAGPGNEPDPFSTAAPAGTGLSKNARKRLIREERMQERKRARREAKRDESVARLAERRAAREAAVAGLDEDERQAVLAARRDACRAGREADRAARARIRDALVSKARYAVCIDLGWNEIMRENELRSLIKQIAYSYSCLRKTAELNCAPMRLSVAGLDTRVEQLLTRQASGWTDWPVELSRSSLLELHPREAVVYLTHDADEVLEELREDRVYVIGGIVDRNRLKGATLEKARKLGVATARLNLDTSVHIQHGTPVLTVNHCVEILQLAASGLSWQAAYLRVLPPRKGLSTKHVAKELVGVENRPVSPSSEAVLIDSG